MKKRILFFIHFDSYFNNLLGVAKLVKKKSEYEPILIFPIEYPNLKRDISAALSYEITCLNQKGEQITTLPKDNFTPNYSQKKNDPAKKYFLTKYFFYFKKICPDTSFIKNVFSKIKYYKKRIEFVCQLIQKENISLIVLGGDIVGHDMPAIIKAGHKKNIASIGIVEWLTAYEGASIYSNNPACKVNNFSTYLVSLIFKHWRYIYQGEKILRLPATELLALELTGLAPSLPWILHSGNLDAIAVEGEQIKRNAISMGLPGNKIFVTGSIQNDRMKVTMDNAKKLKNELYAELLLPLDRPMILTALPPNMVDTSPECEFLNYSELVEFWIKSLVRYQDYNVIVSIHPSSDYETIKYIEQWGVKISRQSTNYLIALCNIYVASVSATIYWAISCGKPVLDYDVYQYKYTNFTDVGGVVTIYDKNEFAKILNSLLSNRDFYDEIKKKQMVCSGQWGKLDGESGNRILSLFDKFVPNLKR